MPRSEWKRENIWLRMALVAPTKAGKTSGALTVASHLFDGVLPITLIDTENRRAAIYAEVFDIAFYRTITGTFSPDVFVREIDEAEAENPGGILIIDSVTHEWNNTGGVLEIVDKGSGGNWKEGTPAHNRFTNRIARCDMHVISCVRAKTKYQWSDDEGKRIAPRKLGVGPEQRDNFLYDYDVEGDIDLATHLCSFTHRAEPGQPAPLNGAVMPLIGKNEDGELDPKAPNEVAEILTAWLSKGEPPAPPEAAPDEQVAELRALLVEAGYAESVIEERFAIARRENRGVLSPDYVTRTVAKIKPVVEKRRAEAAAAEQQKKSAAEPVQEKIAEPVGASSQSEEVST